MNAALTATFAVAACTSGATAVGCAAYLRGKRRERARRREAALEAQGARTGAQRDATQARNWAVRYAESLTRRLFTGAIGALTPSVRSGHAGDTRAGKRFAEMAVSAGCDKSISAAGFCETRTRMAIGGMLAGALVGALLSTELAILLAIAGTFTGASLLPRAVRQMRKSRGVCAERHLSEMLEVVALGLRSGLTFDRSFELYGSHFDNEFAQACARAYRMWSLGLTTRDEALRVLAASFDCSQLARVVDGVLRGLRFGSSITGFLEEAASQSRATYRAALEERVAKAPVKMMLPTGTLILPAMLMLVMGPILLELAGGF